jgi:HD-GYP domain-containing protein (c-di-GMP phosphodiesterase class II)
MWLRPAPEESPEVQRLLAASQARPARALAARELRNELVVGGSFVVAATVLAVLAPGPKSVAAGELILVLGGLVLASRVVFQVGSCYTMPLQLAFVPALFVVPPALVPLVVAAALVIGRSIDVAQGTRRPSRLLNALGDSWFSLGPAAVLVAADSPAADEVGLGILVAALAAQLLVDTLASRAREYLHGGASLTEQLTESAWIYFVDVLLSPLGFGLALAADAEPAAIALGWPLFLLLAVFARERDERLASLLELSEAYRGTARVLGEVVEHEDAYTAAHIRGVAEIAIGVAEDLGLTPAGRRLVEFGALLHDVGKIAIPMEIIQKPGPLDEHEWAVIKTHTLEGQRMLDRIGGLMSNVGRIVRSSHERYDGRGYPDGLAGDEIPIESRIVFCCDAYNAMTTDRVYRPALSQSEALAELRANAGTQFDPGVVEALLRRVTTVRHSARANGHTVDEGRGRMYRPGPDPEGADR